jgi:hypothetical protein
MLINQYQLRTPPKKLLFFDAGLVLEFADDLRMRQA